jgi:hypothetical protein
MYNLSYVAFIVAFLAAWVILVYLVYKTLH